MEMGWSGWLAAALAVLLTGISKSGFGGALSGLAVPVLALWMPTVDAVGVMLPILIAMDVLGLRVWRKAASWPDLYWLLPASLLGIAFGSLLRSRGGSGQAWRRCVDTFSSSATTFISEDVTKKEAAQASTPSN